jgi:cell division protein ZapA
MSDDSGKSVSVEIFGQRYPIRSSLDVEYDTRLATYVDAKIRAARESAPSGDPQRLAVLAALNIADELFRQRDSARAQDGTVVARAEELERLLDRVLLEPGTGTL